MSSSKALSVADFAVLAGITPQAVRKALASGRLWQGHKLLARTVRGRGGSAGERYEILISSLPQYLKDRLKGLHKPLQLELPLAVPGKRHAEITWWAHHLQPLLDTAVGSTERASAVTDLAGKSLLDWKGLPITLSRSTIYKRLGQMASAGLAGVARKRRADLGQAKVTISREWDNAVPFDDDTKRKIAENLSLQIGGLRAKKPERRWVLTLAREWLKGDTAAHGFHANDPAEFDRICTIPTRLYTAQAKYEAVYDLVSDRDRFDNRLPRGGKRTIAGMLPMTQLIGDVHPTDLLIRRPDGNIGVARVIAWLDTATHRVWIDLLMVEKSGGVRGQDVARSFINLCTDPAWGISGQLYVDNGSEYGFVSQLLDFISLPKAIGDDGRPVVRAQPYNAAAKGLIEGFFHRFEYGHLRHVPGWHGGKLGAPKRPSRGKLPAPFEGGFDELFDVIQGHVAAYHAMPQQGELAGDSPNARFRKHVESGWAATIADPTDLLTVFTKTEERTVTKHCISVDGRTWSCPELDAYFGRKVTVRIPTLGLGFNELWIGNDRGQFLGVARPDIARAYNDERQARHSADRKAATTRAVRALKKSVPDIDVGAAIVGYGQRDIPGRPNTPSGTVSVAIPGSSQRAIVPARRSGGTRDEGREDRARGIEAMKALTAARKAMQ